MRHFVVATAVVAFLAAGLAEGQMRSAVPPGTPQTPEVKVQAAIPVPQQPLESARRITREEAIKLVKQKKAIYVDVRPREQFDQGHIQGAYSVPLGEVVSRLGELPPHMFLVTYCA